MSKIFQTGINDEDLLFVSDVQKDELMKKWVEIFAKISYKDFLDLRYNQYIWERLKKENETIESPESLSIYSLQKVSEFFVMQKTKKGHTLCLSTSKNLPVFLYQEIIVFPKNMAWTIIFTHEDNNIEVRSPFFIKSSKYEKLNKKDIEKEKWKNQKNIY